MALTPEDLDQIKVLFASQPVPEPSQPPQADPTPDELAAARVAAVGKPDVNPEAGPLYYVHLANGDVVESYDAASTHLPVDGKSVLVIGRYAVGE